MGKINGLLKDKSYGFYVTLVLIVLSLTAALTYAALYNGSRYMSWPAAGIMLGGVALALVLAFTKLSKWSYAVLALADFAGLLFYVYGIYFYVSVVMVGIQASTFNWQFKFCTAMFVGLLVVNIVNVFLKQTKEED